MAMAASSLVLHHKARSDPMLAFCEALRRASTSSANNTTRRTLFNFYDSFMFLLPVVQRLAPAQHAAAWNHGLAGHAAALVLVPRPFFCPFRIKELAAMTAAPSSSVICLQHRMPKFPSAC